MARARPEPSTGFTAAVSGVAQPQPKAPGKEGSENPFDGPQPLVPPQGLAKLGWLRILKNSARNCAVSRSLKRKFLAIDRSRLRKPVSRKMLRPMVPKVPKAGGIMTELPFM